MFANKFYEKIKILKTYQIEVTAVQVTPNSGSTCSTPHTLNKLKIIRRAVLYSLDLLTGLIILRHS